MEKVQAVGKEGPSFLAHRLNLLLSCPGLTLQPLNIVSLLATLSPCYSFFALSRYVFIRVRLVGGAAADFTLRDIGVTCPCRGPFCVALLRPEPRSVNSSASRC